MNWIVWRQDDNGCRFQVQELEDEAGARELAGRLERTGHKQIYWVEPGPPDLDLEALWEHVIVNCPRARSRVHGVDHWREVERIGLHLSQESDARSHLVRLFALFHDCQRRNDGTDAGHGERGADYAATLRPTLLSGLDDEEFAVLHDACTRHTEGLTTTEATTAVCWDADRLDLGRVGTAPHPRYLSTRQARRWLSRGDVL